MDTFARQSTTLAHRRIAELTREMRRLEKTSVARSVFTGRCYLCGNPTQRRYCHGCSWAEGGGR